MKLKTKQQLLSNPQVFVEEVTESIKSAAFGKAVLASKVRDVTEADIDQSLNAHKLGKCDGTVVIDDKGWLYDIRSCAVCGNGLGTV